MKLLKITSLTIASVAMVTVMTQSAEAQGIIDINTYDANCAVYMIDTNTSAPIGTTYFELFGGASIGSLTPIVSINTHSAINPLTDSDPNGQGGAGGGGSGLDVGYGAVPGVVADGIGYFQVWIWWGSTRFVDATRWFASAVWSQQVGNDSTVGSPPPTPNPANLDIAFANPVMGYAVAQSGQEALIINWVPEPTTMALAGLGGLSLLLFRRRG